MPDTREIKFKAFTYQEVVTDPLGKKRVVNKTAKRGEIVTLPDEAIVLGDHLGAFVTEADEEAAAALVADVSELDHDALTNWVSESSVPDIINVAKDNPSLVSRLLEAENEATGHDPRPGLVEGLAAVAGLGENVNTDLTVDPEARSLALQYNIDLGDVIATGPDGEITESDVTEYYETEILDVTEAARTKAVELEVPLAKVTGTGKDGRILEEDVEKYHDENSETE